MRLKQALARIPAALAIGIMAFVILWLFYRDISFAKGLGLFVTAFAYLYFTFVIRRNGRP